MQWQRLTTTDRGRLCPRLSKQMAMKRRCRGALHAPGAAPPPTAYPSRDRNHPARVREHVPEAHALIDREAHLARLQITGDAALRDAIEHGAPGHRLADAAPALLRYRADVRDKRDAMAR